jgi:rubredoxin
MTEYVRCKACGYIMEASKVKTKCPACGVPASQFEPYKPRIAGKRKAILDIHLHPIVLHFPQAFVTSLVFFALLLAFLGEGALRTTVLGTTKTLAILLPLAVLAAFGAGLIDGKIRFRKVTTPTLVRKMILGALFFAFSLGGAALATLTALDASALLPFALLELLGLVAGTMLGLLGSRLMETGFPG